VRRPRSRRRWTTNEHSVPDRRPVSVHRHALAGRPDGRACRYARRDSHKRQGLRRCGRTRPDALIETWQADPDGYFDHPDDPHGPLSKEFRGFGRCPTDPEGEYWILTLPPGALPGQAPHIDVSVFARGLLHRVVTRIYFSDDPADPVLSSVDPDRRHTLIATPAEDGYTFDIRLQGDGETVFFDV
jgi:protocatechuate 3,4-dioxygenase, alpha subunit